ncbi:MAG: iron-containing alcohol dehydrogenase [Burkholderiales bacterium]|nr:iron-containing alcohol dehydrogenase [Burkholderiales bacterium]
MSAHNTFVLSTLEKVVFSRPCADVIRQEAERLHARRVFLLSVPELSRQTDEVARIKAALGGSFAGLYDSMPAHTPVDAILEAAAMARAAATDLVVTLGGSSVTDAGKVLLICLRHGSTSTDQLQAYRYRVDEGGGLFTPEFAGPDIPFIAVPTTLSGAEFTSIAGARNPARNIKEGYQHPGLVPRTVVLDPAVTVHTPDWLWLSTGVRAVDHAVETLGSLFSNDFCDGIAESALRLLAEGLSAVRNNPADLNARLKCQFGLWQSLIPGTAGIPMGASHAIGHVLGGYLNVPHGYTSCVMAAAVLRHNSSHNADRQRRIAQALGEPRKSAAEAVAGFIENLGMPTTVRAVGVQAGQFSAVAERCMAEPWIWTNPRPISRPEDVVDILNLAA